VSVVYCGIDEAGYGPTLGPLTVAMSRFEIRDWTPGEPAPELWKLLSRAVCKTVKGAGRRIPIADSKKLKLPNDAKRAHPCAHLERAVLAGLLTRGEEAPDDTSLVELVRAAMPDLPWYAGDPVLLPLAGEIDSIRIDANALSRACDRAGVTFSGLHAHVVPETTFNEVVRRTGSKAATTAGPLAELIRDAANSTDGPVRIICDRQSGRLDYEDILARAFRDEPVELDARTPRSSRYLLRDGRVAVHFETCAEASHMPTALASMTAKLLRELMMLRFNRHFSARRPDLRPTAGYYRDAQRWLADTADLLTEEERRLLVRIA
jgi:hypothetical protein